MTIVQVIFPHEYCWFQCYRREHFPYRRMFFFVFCKIHRRSFLSFPHLIIHPAQEWSRFHWQFWFCFIVSNDKLLWPYFSLWVITTGCPRSIMRFFLIHNGLPRSIVLGSSYERNLIGGSCVFRQEVTNRLHRSIIHRFVSFPLLRRPSFVIIPLWVACWETAFSKLFVIIARCGSWVTAHNGLHRSILFLSFRTPGTLISITFLPRAFWRRRWQIRGSPCDKTHHWPRFRCDSLWILLCSFLPSLQNKL